MNSSRLGFQSEPQCPLEHYYSSSDPESPIRGQSREVNSALQFVPIVDVHPGDYVLSLNEETQKIEPHRINDLLDMGVKPVFKLTIASGRSIRTTGNHPYLVKDDGSRTL